MFVMPTRRRKIIVENGHTRRVPVRRKAKGWRKGERRRKAQMKYAADELAMKETREGRTRLLKVVPPPVVKKQKEIVRQRDAPPVVKKSLPQDAPCYTKPDEVEWRGCGGSLMYYEF